MHAILVSVRIDAGRADEAEKMLRERTVPMASSFDGFVKGYWCRADDGTRGRSIIVFESEAAAKAAADQVLAPPDSAVTLESVEVFRVLAEA
jgi:heme-degrading monooxygenase HmoA